MASRTRAFLVFAIIFFSSTQFGLHFWPNSAFLYGLRLDYLSPTLYFLDILILIHLGLNLTRQLHFSKLAFLLPLLLVNLLFSHNPLASLSWSLHLILYLSFISSLSPSTIRYSLFSILPLTLLFQLVLGGLQVFQGHSLQGIFYYFGERAFSLASPNIAKGEFFGEVILRAYGTFSHPNTLAGYAVIALLITIELWRQRQSSVGLTLKDSSAISTRKDPGRSDPMGTKTVWIIATLATLLVFFTQSRSATLALFGIVIPFFLLKSPRSRVVYFFLSLVTCLFIVTTGYLGLRHESSFSERISLQTTSLQVIRTFPVFGAGAEASISTYPLLSPTNPRGAAGLQPDHNSFTLFLSWFGFFGSLATLYSLRSHIIHYSLFIIPLLPLLLLDHHLLTSPQGLFIFLLYLKVSNFAKLRTHANQQY